MTKEQNHTQPQSLYIADHSEVSQAIIDTYSDRELVEGLQKALSYADSSTTRVSFLNFIQNLVTLFAAYPAARAVHLGFMVTEQAEGIAVDFCDLDDSETTDCTLFFSPTGTVFLLNLEDHGVILNDRTIVNELRPFLESFIAKLTPINPEE